MKITIDLPVNTTPEQAEQIKAKMMRLIDPEWLAVWWHTSDVQDVAEQNLFIDDLPTADAIEVLKIVDDTHDANEGVSWSTIEWAIEEIVNARA